jgi:hypothetical protein
MPIKLFGDVNNWQNLKVYSADLKIGDVISIKGKNQGKLTPSNPAGMLATIQYLNPLGEIEQISTGPKWTCDGTTPLLLGKNSGKTVWNKANKGSIPFINKKAQWIWSNHGTDSATCTLIIPGGGKRYRYGKIDLSVDNILQSVTVNGKAIKLTGPLNNWAEVKSIKTIIRPGDEIAISGQNIGAVTQHNPASMVATIKYIDNEGKLKILNTDHTWTCDGSSPYLQGENGADTIWTRAIGSSLPLINPKAQWIWNKNKSHNAICRVIIPVEQKGVDDKSKTDKNNFGRCSRFKKNKANNH